MRVALVHDWLNQAGGAEVVLGVLHEMIPDAPIFTTLVDPARVPAADGWDVRAGWMNRLPGIHAHHQPYLPLYPLAWEMTRLTGHDLVLSVKSGFCHGVRAGNAVHVCYCLTPTRYVWQLREYLAFEAVPAAARLAVRGLMPVLRRWDRRAANRVDYFIAISTTVQDRIGRFYGRSSTVIHPPADPGRYRVSSDVGDYHLVLARLVPYKRIDLAVRAFTRLGRRLVVVGEGRDRARLEAMAGPAVTFRGRLPDEEVVDLLAGCRGLVWPGVEDYGLAPIEVMASGRPVIARRLGGVLDTVVEGRTGVFFDEPEVDALVRAVERAEAISWDPAAIRAHAERFGRTGFEARMGEFLRRAVAEGKRR